MFSTWGKHLCITLLTLFICMHKFKKIVVEKSLFIGIQKFVPFSDDGFRTLETCPYFCYYSHISDYIGVLLNTKRGNFCPQIGVRKAGTRPKCYYGRDWDRGSIPTLSTRWHLVKLWGPFYRSLVFFGTLRG